MENGLRVASVVSIFIRPAYQPKVYPIYEEALVRALQNIQEGIPHEDLSIQLDLAIDTAFYEGVYFDPWFKGTFDVKEYVVDTILRMVKHIDADVELGIHNCYGIKMQGDPSSTRANDQQATWNTSTSLSQPR